MRGRRFASQQDIERHVANGFGEGAGVSYVPWLRVQDVPSRGRSHKIQGVKVDRTRHFFSDLERSYFIVCEFSEDVVDIREQFMPNTSATTASRHSPDSRKTFTRIESVFNIETILPAMS